MGGIRKLKRNVVRVSLTLLGVREVNKHMKEEWKRRKRSE